MPDISPPLSTATLLADAAMGTMLYIRRVCFEECFDALNMSNPAGVAPVDPEHIEAGAQIALTNTFVSDRFKPELVGLATRRAEAESLLRRVHA